MGLKATCNRAATTPNSAKASGADPTTGLFAALTASTRSSNA